MHRLLVPVDSSECASRALGYALKLARENGPMEIVLVHAHEAPIVYGEVSLYLSQEKAAQMLRQHSADVLSPAIEAAKAAGVPFTSEILTGYIADEIVACAGRRGCDTIVMGTRGMSAIGNLVMGSVATKVVHLSTVPVTLVK